MPDVKMADILDVLNQKLSLIRNHAISSWVTALQTSALSFLLLWNVFCDLCFFCLFVF